MRLNNNDTHLKQGACFVAGTLVHTARGLVPIQDIKVGDKVLSRDENNPDGELAYKKVLSTFKSAQKQKIIYVRYQLLTKGKGHLFCTESHPFWVDEIKDHSDENNIVTEPVGWLPAIDLDGNELHALRTLDDELTVVATYRDRYKKLTSMRCNINWAGMQGASDPEGIVDFSSGKPVLLGGGGSRFWHPTNISVNHLLSTEQVQIFPNTDDVPEIQAYLDDHTSALGDGDYTDYVYNIEVEDYHTYFVGDVGVWVHNCDPNTVA